MCVLTIVFAIQQSACRHLLWLLDLIEVLVWSFAIQVNIQRIK